MVTVPRGKFFKVRGEERLFTLHSRSVVKRSTKDRQNMQRRKGKQTRIVKEGPYWALYVRGS